MKTTIRKAYAITIRMLVIFALCMIAALASEGCKDNPVQSSPVVIQKASHKITIDVTSGNTYQWSSNKARIIYTDFQNYKSFAVFLGDSLAYSVNEDSVVHIDSELINQ